MNVIDAPIRANVMVVDLMRWLVKGRKMIRKEGFFMNMYNMT